MPVSVANILSLLYAFNTVHYPAGVGFNSILFLFQFLKIDVCVIMNVIGKINFMIMDHVVNKCVIFSELPAQIFVTIFTLQEWLYLHHLRRIILVH